MRGITHERKNFEIIRSHCIQKFSYDLPDSHIRMVRNRSTLLHPSVSPLLATATGFPNDTEKESQGRNEDPGWTKAARSLMKPEAVAPPAELQPLRNVEDFIFQIG